MEIEEFVLELENYSFNVEESPEDDRDYSLDMYTLEADYIDEIPVEYFSGFKPKVKNQSKSDMCMAFQMSYAKDNQEGFITSPAWTFYYSHLLDPRPNKGGLIPRIALKALKDFGIVPVEKLDAIGTFKKISKAITEAKVKYPTLAMEAKKYAIGSYARLRNIKDMKKAILEQDIIIAGIPVYDGLIRAKQIIGLPKPGEEYKGGHAVGLIGWTKKGWILLNSWSEKWGIKGISILPYDYPIWESWVLFDKEPDKKRKE